MERCRTCKWWESSEDQSDEIEHPFDPDTYEPMQMPYQVRRCEQPDQTFCEFPTKDTGFALADGSTYWAKLYTAENFGCVLHERND